MAATVKRRRVDEVQPAFARNILERDTEEAYELIDLRNGLRHPRFQSALQPK